MKTSHINTILKMFNFNNIQAEISAYASAIITFIIMFTKDYLGISGTMMIALFLILIADFITGIIASKKENIPITSNKGLTTVYKVGAYMLFLFITFTFYKELDYYNSNAAIVAKYAHIYIMGHALFWEMFSVDENLKRIGLDLEITDFITGLLNKLKNLIK